MKHNSRLIYPNDIMAYHCGQGFTSQRVRDRMVERLCQQLNLAPEVAYAMRVVPRHLFVDEAFHAVAYQGDALPIGHGQSISQASIVAQMTQTLWHHVAHPTQAKILEIGTGSGYQTALLSLLFGQVYTVERIPPLQGTAKGLLDYLQLRNVHYQLSDGHYGWTGSWPVGGFDGILVTAAPDHVPSGLIEQLSTDQGVLILPTGDQMQQTLKLIMKQDQQVTTQNLAQAWFVPLVSGVSTGNEP